MAREHHTIDLLGIWPPIGKRAHTTEDPVVEGEGTLHGHELGPPGIDALLLGKEAVPANVHAVAVVLDGARYATDCLGLLKDGNLKLFGRTAQKLMRCGDARRTGPDDDDSLQECSN